MTAAREQAQTTTTPRRRFSAGGLPSARLSPLCVAAVAVALAAAARAGSAPAQLESPQVSELGRAPAVIADTTLRASGLRSFAARASYWGGPFTAATGEVVTVLVSSSYPEDPATGQRWADFLAGLLHGSELSSATAYLAPLAEVQEICGQRALACYSPGRNLIVTPGEDPAPDASAEAVLTHEYGHHVAANRSNAPWPAVDYGTKRWASYQQVCARARRGELVPGAEDSLQYELNPGEAFAETYRVLNQRRAGAPELAWGIVADWLYPDDTALALVEQDVTAPWQANIASTRTASLTNAKRQRVYAVPTPLDGTLNVTLRVPPKARFTLYLDSPTGTTLQRVSGSGSLSLSTTICGQRTFRVRVARVAGTGTFRLTTSSPA